MGSVDTIVVDNKSIFKRIDSKIKKFFSDRAILSKAKKAKKEQSTFVYCPTCHNELVGDINLKTLEHLSFIREGYVKESNNPNYSKERNVVHYKCSKCETESFWDFDLAPLPLLLPLTKNDNIINDYKKTYSN